MTFILSIMGNIGSGKSTLIHNLNDLGYNVVQEPIHKWGDWLDLFYQNPSKYAFSFQMKVLIDFEFDDIKQSLTIVERSPLESKEVFAKTLLQDKKINTLEYDLLCNYHDKIAWKPNAILYLKLSPEECMNRINKRSRECETGISLEYLKQLHQNYYEFVNRNNNIPIFEIDANQDENQVKSEVFKVLNLLSSAINHTTT